MHVKQNDKLRINSTFGILIENPMNKGLMLKIV